MSNDNFNISISIDGGKTFNTMQSVEINDSETRTEEYFKSPALEKIGRYATICSRTNELSIFRGRPCCMFEELEAICDLSLPVDITLEKKAENFISFYISLKDEQPSPQRNMDASI